MTSQITVSFWVKDKKYQMEIALNSGWRFKSQESAREWWSSYVHQFFIEHRDIDPTQIRKITEHGVTLIDGRTINAPDLLHCPLLAAKKAALAWKTMPAISGREPPLPDISAVDRPEPVLREANVAEARFEYIDEPHLLDRIPPPQARWRKTDHLSRESLVELETADLVRKARERGEDPSPKKIQETRQGVNLSIDRRRNTRLIVELQGALQAFYRRDRLVSDEIFAKNSPLNGVVTKEGVIHDAVTSSFVRLADNVSMLRAVLDETGSSDCYTGRADTLEKAKEIAQFVFLGEITQRHPNGIRQTKDGVYELTLVVQSLLDVHDFSEEHALFEKERAAYRELIRVSQEHPLKIRNPQTGKIYRVRINPLLPIGENQFNHTTRIPFLGRAAEKAASFEADAMLAQLAEQKMKGMHDRDKIARIRYALQSLQNGSLTKRWQKIMTRAYLCYLLDLPEVVHCLSSVDRTGAIVIPMIFAMKRYLRSGRPVPMAIHEIVDQFVVDASGRRIYPFKELFAYKMHHELKVTEYSRGRKGFNVNQKRFGKLGPRLIQDALPDLLPSRYYLDGDHWNEEYENVRDRFLLNNDDETN
jgi:hypothetical protein